MLAIATLLAIFGTLAINTLSNIFPPGGENVGEIANTTLAGVLITPANYAFAIWGLIYVGLIAYGVYQLRPAQRQDPVLQTVNRCLIVACVAQMLWIGLFTLKYFTLSIPVMLVILGALIVCYQALKIGQPARRDRRWYANYPFGLYLGWIAVATVVNIASALYAADWSGWGLGDVAWTQIMVVVSGLIAALVIWTKRDIAFTLVFCWAYGAIAIRHGDSMAIAGTAIATAAILLIFLLLRRYQGQLKMQN
ncbi:MAG: tryptophan-rich sensory protein [Leptolyngbyaceae cyanobacterium]